MEAKVSQPTVELAKLDKSERQKNYHNSLPSRNFKMVDDIRSLFDKLTSSKNHQSRSSSSSVFYSESTEALRTDIKPNAPVYLHNSELSTFKKASQSKVEATKLKLSQSFQSTTNPSSVKKKQEPNVLTNSASSLLTVGSEKNKWNLESASFNEPSSSSSKEAGQVFLSKSIKKMTELEQESPDSPKKGSLKKKGLARDSSLTRSPLKVRWKDMIEISNCIQSDSESDETDPEFSDLSNDAEMASISNESKNQQLLGEQKFANEFIITAERKNRKCEGTEHKFNLKPLHATGKEFEREMMDRIQRLNQIKTKKLDDTQVSKILYGVTIALDV